MQGLSRLPVLLDAMFAGGGSLLSAGFIIWAISGWLCVSRRILVISRVKAAGLPEGGIKGIECWGYLINISIYDQYFWLYLRKQIHGAFNRQEQNQTAP